MPIKSLDPRVTRAEIPENEELTPELSELDHWQTYEVFSQAKKGDRHIHAGSLHAPNPEMAYILAKEQFGRRNKCVSIWVVKTSDVFSLDTDEEELYERNNEKVYREAGGYKVMEKINAYKKANTKE
jgi:ring-1,2-phenylacetyl-CoA epoxidase subunit PaaB